MASRPGAHRALPPLPEAPLEKKRQHLLCAVASGQSRDFLGKPFTQEAIEKMKPELVTKYYAIYETVFNARVSENIVKNIISLASKGVGCLLPIDSAEGLSRERKAEQVTLGLAFSLFVVG